jgi:hypothetical protein
VIRGIATLPNLSFVCAGDREVIVETVKGDLTDKSLQYFEKFFPIVISVPEPSPESLRKAGIERVVAALNECDWFANATELAEFRTAIEGLWDARIAPFCHNLRQIGLLANAVSVAAAPLRREVNPIDLTLLEMLNRFRPSVYKLIADHPVVLTGGESLLRGGPYQDDTTKERAGKRLLDHLQNLVPDENELENVKGVLGELFPLFSTLGKQVRAPRKRKEGSADETEKRISEPGMFPAYFRYELPEAIYSFVEIASLRQRLEGASSQAARETIFFDALHTMDKGSLKRDDFLRKLANLAKVIDVTSARSLGEAAARASAEYTYDTFPTFGEAGHALRLLHAVAQRLKQRERVEFLRDCILSATDDTMALRILTILTQQKDDSKIDVDLAELYPSFIARMRNRYGRDIDATNIDLSASDPWAFDYWGHTFDGKGVKSDPKDRVIQNEFWLRYIGNSRRRLAEAFRRFFLPVAVYGNDAALAVENKISLADLSQLYERLPEEGELSTEDEKSLHRLRRLLDGDFKQGIDPLSEAWR